MDISARASIPANSRTIQALGRAKFAEGATESWRTFAHLFATWAALGVVEALPFSALIIAIHCWRLTPSTCECFLTFFGRTFAVELKVNTVVSAFTTVVASKRTLPRNGENSKECNKSDLDDLQKMLLLHSFVLYYYAQNRESQRSAYQQITEVERCY